MTDFSDKCPVLAEMYATGKALGSDGTTHQVGSHLPSDDAGVLYEMVESVGGGDIIEIGMAFGASTLAILSAAPVTLRSIDPYQLTDWKGCGVESVKRAGFSDRHELDHRPDYVALPWLLSTGRQYRMAFIDGYHTFDHTFLDWWYVDKMISPGGIVGFDDCYMPSVQKVIAFIAGHRKYSVIRSSPSQRTIYLRKDENHEPAWDYFSPF